MRYDITIRRISSPHARRDATGRFQVGMTDAQRWLENWGYWRRAQYEQVGAGSGAVRAAEDAHMVGKRENGLHSDPVLVELLTVEMDPEHELSRRIDLSVQGMDERRQAVCLLRFRGVIRRVHGVPRWERPDWPEIGKRCGKIGAHAAQEIARGAKQIVLADMAEALASVQSPAIKIDLSI